MSLSRNLAALAALAAVAAPAAPAAAQPSWTMVGSSRLDEAGSGTMSVKWQPAFREVMFCADEGNVKLNDAVFRFRDGRTKTLKLRTRIADMDCSRTLGVGKNEDVATIDLSYDPASLKGARTKVSLSAR